MAPTLVDPDFGVNPPFYIGDDSISKDEVVERMENMLSDRPLFS